MSLRTVRGQFLSGLFPRTLPGKKRLLGHPILFNRARVYVPTAAASVRVPQMFHRQRAVAVGAFRHVLAGGATRRFSSSYDLFVELFCHALFPCNIFRPVFPAPRGWLVGAAWGRSGGALTRTDFFSGKVMCETQNYIRICILPSAAEVDVPPHPHTARPKLKCHRVPLFARPAGGTAIASKFLASSLCNTASYIDYGVEPTATRRRDPLSPP